MAVGIERQSPPRQFHSKSVKDCAELAGLTPPALAVMLRDNLDEARGQGPACRSAACDGEPWQQIDGSTNPKGLNFNAPTMVIIGAGPERLAALRSGGAPIEAKSHAPELPDASDAEEMEFDVRPPPRSNLAFISPKLHHTCWPPAISYCLLLVLVGPSRFKLLIYFLVMILDWGFLGAHPVCCAYLLSSQMEGQFAQVNWWVGREEP